MESMENLPVRGPIREKSEKESGYSEEEQSKVIEGSTVDLRQLKKRKPLVTVNKQSKILEAYQKVHDQITELLRGFNNSAENPRYQEKVIEEVKLLREIQEELIQCLLLEQAGELTEQTASNRAWNLIQ